MRARSRLCLQNNGAGAARVSQGRAEGGAPSAASAAPRTVEQVHDAAAAGRAVAHPHALLQRRQRALPRQQRAGAAEGGDVCEALRRLGHIAGRVVCQVADGEPCMAASAAAGGDTRLVTGRCGAPAARRGLPPLTCAALHIWPSPADHRG